MLYDEDATPDDFAQGNGVLSIADLSIGQLFVFIFSSIIPTGFGLVGNNFTFNEYLFISSFVFVAHFSFLKTNLLIISL